MVHLQDLPDDVIFAIFAFLSPQDILAIEQVRVPAFPASLLLILPHTQTCRGLHTLGSFDHVWHALSFEIPLDLLPSADHTSYPAHLLKQSAVRALRLDHNWRRREPKIRRLTRIPHTDIVHQLHFVGSSYLVGLSQSGNLATYLTVWNTHTPPARIARIEVAQANRFSASLDDGELVVGILTTDVSNRGSVTLYSLVLGDPDEPHEFQEIFCQSLSQPGHVFFDIQVSDSTAAVGFAELLGAIRYKLLLVDIKSRSFRYIHLPSDLLGSIQFKLHNNFIFMATAGLESRSKLLVFQYDLNDMTESDQLPPPVSQYETETSMPIFNLEYHLSCEPTVHGSKTFPIAIRHTSEADPLSNYLISLYQIPLEPSHSRGTMVPVDTLRMTRGSTIDLICLGETGRRIVWLERLWEVDDWQFMRAGTACEDAIPLAARSVPPFDASLNPMDLEIDQLVQAIAIASDPSQSALYQQALGYIQSIQQNASETWQLALRIFVDSNPDGRRKYPAQARFWALRVLDDFLDNRFEPLDQDTFQTLQQAIVNYIQSEYVGGPAEVDAPFLRNKFSHTLTLFFLCTYVEQWPSFFTDIFTLIQPASQSSTAGFNRHISLLFFHLVLEISGEVADQMIKSARAWNEVRHARDSRVRDAVRDRDAARINEAVLTIVDENADRMRRCRENPSTQESTKELGDAIEVVDWGIRTFGSYVGWIDINLTVTQTTVPLLFKLLADASLPIRLATSVALLRIVSKGLKEPGDKLQLLKVLSLGEVLDALEDKTRKQQIERGADTDEAEESYREALGKLLNVLGLELTKLIDEPSTPETIRAEAMLYLQQLQPVMLRFMADDYDDTASTVFPLLAVILTSYKRSKKVSPEPIDDQKRSFLANLLEVILLKMKWDGEAEPDDVDDDDNAEFEKMRKELRTFMDSVLTVDQDLVTNAIRTLAINTMTAYQSGTQLEWNDAELGVYLVYIFGEINKTGGKGRAAFCHAPAIQDKEKKKTDYSAYPLTSHGEMLSTLVHSGIASYPHRAVSLQFFETVARYPDFFKVRKECILPTLEAMIDIRGLHNDNPTYRSRLFYLFHRFIKESRNEIQADISVTIVNSMRDLLPIQVEISEPEEPEGDLLSEAIKSTMFDSQLYLFETVGILTSVTSKNPEQQGALLLSLVKPLMEELSANLQLFRNGTQDLVPVVKVHHIIMALGNISKGFPDYPATVPENYMVPAVKVFAEVAQAILVCLEAMNILKPIRDATRFAFARILATAGPSVTTFIPPLMNNLLAHFEPSELVDFMNFIGLLIHKLQNDMFDVLDKLIGPLNAHIIAMLSQVPSGTDETRSQSETKKAYLNLLIAVVSSKLEGIFTSEQNSGSFESFLGSMLGLVKDVSDPGSQKAALSFFGRCVTVWGQPLSQPSAPNGHPESQGLPGFDRFIYEQLVPTAFAVPSLPEFNLKDGQILVVLHEIANLLQTVVKVREHEAQTYFATAFLPSKGWPSNAAIDFSTKLRELDSKSFRKYFTDLIRESRASS